MKKKIHKAVGNDDLMLNNPKESFFYKHLIIIGIIFFFFNFERGMKLFVSYKREKVLKIISILKINEL